MEFAWINKECQWKVNTISPPPGYISGLRISSDNDSTGAMPTDGGLFWQDLLYHGIGVPLSHAMFSCFFENGTGFKELPLSKAIASHLAPGDLVLNLNYDTVFELALEQIGMEFSYSPLVRHGCVLVAKPHGSLNCVMNETVFMFGQPDWLGLPQPPGFSSYSGLIPPRLNKSYAQHPLAPIILEPAQNRRPEKIVMWGVGFTESDADLMQLYQLWGESAELVEVINPDKNVVEKAACMFHGKVEHFPTIQVWQQAHSGNSMGR